MLNLGSTQNSKMKTSNLYALLYAFNALYGSKLRTSNIEPQTTNWLIALQLTYCYKVNIILSQLQVFCVAA
jgi:hypothetical protein